MQRAHPRRSGRQGGCQAGDARPEAEVPQRGDGQLDDEDDGLQHVPSELAPEEHSGERPTLEAAGVRVALGRVESAPHLAEDHDASVRDRARRHGSPLEATREGDGDQDMHEHKLEGGHAIEGKDDMRKCDMLLVRLAEEQVARVLAISRLHQLSLPCKLVAHRIVRVAVRITCAQDRVHGAHLPKRLVHVVIHDALVDGLSRAPLDFTSQHSVQGGDHRVQEVLVELKRAMQDFAVGDSVRSGRIGAAVVSATREAQPLPRAVEDEAHALGQVTHVGGLSPDEQEEHELMQLHVCQPRVGWHAAAATLTSTLGCALPAAHSDASSHAAGRGDPLGGVGVGQPEMRPPVLEVAKRVCVQLADRRAEGLVIAEVAMARDSMS